MRSRPPSPGVPRGLGRKVLQRVLLECFWAPASGCPNELSEERLLTFWSPVVAKEHSSKYSLGHSEPRARKHSRSTLWGTSRPGPLGFRKRLVEERALPPKEGTVTWHWTTKRLPRHEGLMLSQEGRLPSQGICVKWAPFSKFMVGIWALNTQGRVSSRVWMQNGTFMMLSTRLDAVEK